MTLAMADIAPKILDDCGFMKNETAEVLEKLHPIKSRLIAGQEVLISGFGKLGRQIQAGQGVGETPKLARS